VEPTLVDAMLATDDHNEALATDDPVLNFVLLPQPSQPDRPAFAQLGVDKGAAKLRVRIEYSVNHAAALLRAGDARSAFTWSLTPMTLAEDAAGGREELITMLGQGTPSLLGELSVAFLGVFAASLRQRQDLAQRVHERWVDYGRDLVCAYTVHEHDVVIYPRTQALAVQWMYLLIQGSIPNDEALVEALYALDVRTRPKNPRVDATRFLRDVEIARWRGDEIDAQRRLREAHRQLAAAGLQRHLRFTEAPN
jgi:hypothetical protein